MIKINEFRNMAAEDLREKETALRKELMQLRFQAKTGKLERQGAIRETRRTIARLLTALNEQRQENPVKSAAPKKAKAEAKPVKAAKAEEKKTVKKKTEAKAEKAPAKKKGK
jgi:large subunit ribosomal protein L29